VKWPPELEDKGMRAYERRDGSVVATPSQEIIEARQQQPTRTPPKGKRGADCFAKTPKR
jgi:hypothetical protein